MKLIEVDSQQGPCSQDEFNNMKAERQNAVVTLLRSDNALLNMVAVAATQERRTWMINDGKLMDAIQEWLGQQAKLQEAESKQ